MPTTGSLKILDLIPKNQGFKTKPSQFMGLASLVSKVNKKLVITSVRYLKIFVRSTLNNKLIPLD